MEFYLPEFIFDAPPHPEYAVVPQIESNLYTLTAEVSMPQKVTTKSFKVRVAKWTLILGAFLLVISFAPSLLLSLSGETDKFKVGSVPAITASAYQPKFDKALPLENKIKIPAIGVDSSMNEATEEDHEEALKKGIWRVSDFGTPYDRELPTILTAHRFGYLNWSNIFRRSNSFYNLPKLASGDTVEIVWRQRKYVYAIYGESTGTEITDYNADLILYTCQDLSSDVRIFRYARLLEI